MRVFLKIAFGMLFLFSTTFFTVHVVGKIWNDRDVTWFELAQLAIIDASKMTIVILFVYLSCSWVFRALKRNKG